MTLRGQKHHFQEPILTQRQSLDQTPGWWVSECLPSFNLYLRWFLLGTKGFPGGASGEEPAGQGRRHKRRGFDPWVGKIPWRRAWQPTVFLPGESHGQRSLVGYNPWGRKESDMTEQLSKHMKHLGMSGPFLSVRNLQHFTFIPA